MLKFLSMRAVSLSATMVLSVSGIAVAASHVADEVPVDPVPVIVEDASGAVEESTAIPEAGVDKEEAVAKEQLPCLDCSESVTGDLLELPSEVECQDGNHGKTVSYAARNDGDVRAAAHSDCGKKHRDQEPPTDGDTAATIGTAAEAPVETDVQVTSEGSAEFDAAIAEVEVVEDDGSGRDKAKNKVGSNGKGQGKDKKTR